MKTLLNLYKDRLGLRQDQIRGVEVKIATGTCLSVTDFVTSTSTYTCMYVQLMKDDGISIRVTITESQSTTSGANVTLLVGQMQQDVCSSTYIPPPPPMHSPLSLSSPPPPPPTHIHTIHLLTLNTLTHTQYQSSALVIRYNRAMLEPSGD